MAEYIENTQLAELDEEFDPSGFLQDGEYRDLDVITGEIIIYKQQAGSAILEIGRRLIEAKAQLGHGEWLPYLRDRVDFSETTARRMMRLAREYSNQSPVTDLGAKKALQLLAFSPVERDEFLAQNDVEKMSSRELEEAIKARKAAEIERDCAIADTENVRRDLLEQLEEQRCAHELDMEGATAKLREAELAWQAALNTTADLKRQLAELDKPRPADPKELDAAKKAAVEAGKLEAEKKLKKQIAAAEEKAKQATEAKAQAESEAAAAKLAYEQAAEAGKRERELLDEESTALRKKLAMAGSSEMAIFKVHFEAMQEQANRMMACAERAEASGQGELAEKMRNAVRGICTALLTAAGGA